MQKIHECNFNGGDICMYCGEEKSKNFPKWLDIELTNRCQLTCEDCPYHGKKGVYRFPCDLDFEVYKKIIEEAKGNIESIKFGFGGEPLLYKKILDAIDYTKQYDIKILINTNGLLLDLNLSMELLKRGLDVLTLSDYDIEEQYKRGCIFGVQKQIFGECKFIVKSNNKEKWKDIADEIIDFHNYNYSDLTPDLRKSNFQCEIPKKRLLILSDGTFYKCSCGFIHDKKILGNIEDFTIGKVWNLQSMKLFRKRNKERNTHLNDICVICPVRKEYLKKEGIE